jgi:oxaloacetate decarboxylase (Na+ extruding) subunit alpha
MEREWCRVKQARLIETTLRDGNQSLWATRMTTDMILPVLEDLDNAGFYSIEMISSVQQDACVRYLGEDAWERIRVIRKHMHETPLRVLGMSQFFSISRVLPDDVVELYQRVCARLGIEHHWITASMNDVRTCEVGLRAAKDEGGHTEGGLQYTISPVHTDEFFVNVATQLKAFGFLDGIVLKDAGGLLTPERLRGLLPKLIEAVAPLPINVHSHCITGLGPATGLEAMEQGANAIWTCSAPLANGSSLPASESMVAYLEWMGYQTGVQSASLERMAEHWREIARRYNKPLGVPAEYDPRHYTYQIPGGMISNFHAHLAEIGMQDRLQEVLEEIPRVRAEMGYPNMQTPYSQFVATQALFNVLHGRYEVVADEVRRFVLGYWGRAPGPVDQNVIDKVGKGEDVVTDKPGLLVPPLLPTIREKFGPFDSDEDLLSAAIFLPETLAKMREMKAERERSPISFAASGSVVDLVKEAARSPKVKRFVLVDKSSPHN